MMVSKVPAGHVRALVERPYDQALAAAANDLLQWARPDAVHGVICGARWGCRPH